MSFKRLWKVVFELITSIITVRNI